MVKLSLKEALELTFMTPKMFEVIWGGQILEPNSSSRLKIGKLNKLGPVQNTLDVVFGMETELSYHLNGLTLWKRTVH